jgi:hypothetical protein
MKIAVFLDHDVIVRHFAISRVFSALAARHEVRFVFPEIGNKRVSMRPEALDLLGCAFARLPLDRKRHYLWSTLLFVNYLRWRPGAIHTPLRAKLRRQFPKKLVALYTLLGLPGLFGLTDWFVRKRLAGMPNAGLEAFLDDFQPDAIVHPSILEGIYINDLVDVSARRRVPLVVVMNSWDNPSSKRAVTGTPDWMLVWGDQTRQHAIDFVAMPPARAVCFGAAQFSAFEGPPRIDRAEFCRRNVIDPSRRILLYAGSSKETDEFKHVRALEDAIERGELGDTTVVYRPHPWGEGGKGGARFLAHPWKHVRIESTMRGYLEAIARGDLSMSFPDYRDTHDVLSSVDAVISPLSTILIEAAIHGKPVMCYLPLEETDANHLQLVAHMPHFDDLVDNPNVVVARNIPELLAAAAKLLESAGDPGIAERMVALSHHFVTPFADPYAKRLADFVEQVVPKDAQ